jgi:hypothetical protein
VASAEGDSAAALALQRESLAIFFRLGDRRGIATSLEGLACVALAMLGPDRAARLWGAAARLREEIGSPMPLRDRHRYDHQVAAARTALGDTGAFDLAWLAGRAMTLEQTVAYVLEKQDA